MAALVPLLIVLALVGGSDAAWCICKPDQSSTALQKALDYACGAGADCSPISQNGACYNPNTVVAHCSYAANSYYQRKGQAQGTCDFSGTAMTTPSDPSGSGCTYPATPSAAGSGSSTNTSTPGSSTTPGSGFTPNTGTGTGTGVIGGLGPAGTTSLDGSGAGFMPMVKIGTTMFALSILAIAMF